MLRILFLFVFTISMTCGFTARAETFVYRYKSNLGSMETSPVNEEYGLGNDIEAFYVAPTGHDFSKAIPVSTEDVVHWRKDSGDWPEGIALNETSGRMSGNPSSAGKYELLYHGYDSHNRRIARARLFFSVFDPVGVARHADFYAHTGRYFYSKLPGPAGLQVYRWDSIATNPAGTSLLGDAFQGMPKKAGTYSVGWRGFDFVGREIAFVYGDLTVEDGPVIRNIADQTIDIHAGERFDVRAVVDHAVGDLKFNLVAEEGDPTGLAFDNIAGTLKGSFATFNTKAKYHITVVDKGDGTKGVSNSFTLATAPVSIKLSDLSVLTGYVNQAFRQPMASSNPVAGATWALRQGTLPDGISLDPTTGLILGKPTKAGVSPGIVVSVSGPDMTGIESPPFTFKVLPEALEFETSALMTRIDTPFVTSAPTAKTGAVPPYVFDFAKSASSVLLGADGAFTESPGTGLKLDKNNGSISSQGLQTSGNFSVTLTGSNADGVVSSPFVQTISVFNPPAISYAVPEARRLAPLLIEPTVPDASVAGTPTYVLNGVPPRWMKFDTSTGRFTGTPEDPSSVGLYGPFTVTLSDTLNPIGVTSEPFNIEIKERLPLQITVGSTDVERFVDNTVSPFTASNSYKSVTYRLVSGKLGGKIEITEDGFLVGATDDPVGTIYSDLVVEAEDADSMKAQTLPPFSVKVVEPKELSSLSGKLDQTLQWTRDVPFALSLAAPYNTYGKIKWSAATSIPGVALDGATGKVSGTVTVKGVQTTTFSIADETSRNPASGLLTLDIRDPMTVSMDSVYEINRNSPHVITPNVVDGIGSVAYTLVGVPPKGMNFSPSTGSISGTPSLEGKFGPYTLTTSDAAGTKRISSFDIVVGAPEPFSIAYSPSFRFTPADEYWLEPKITNPVGEVSYSLVKGSLPKGVSLEKNGNYPGWIIGTPERIGFYPVTIRGTTDAGKTTYDADYTIVVSPYGPVSFQGAAFAVHAGVRFSYALNPRNVLLPMRYSLGGEAPAGISVDASGLMTGTIDLAGQNLDLVVNAADAVDRKGSATFSIKVIDRPSVSTAPTTSGKQWQTLSVPATPSNLIGEASFSLAEKSASLPIGLSVNASTGAIEGVPEVAGIYRGISVAMTDAFDGFTVATPPMTIEVAQRDPLVITIPAEVVSKRYSQINLPATVDAAVGAVSWSISPALPNGLTLVEGTISGTPITLSPATRYTVSATDSKGGKATTSFLLQVVERDPLEVYMPAAVTAKQWREESHKLVAVGAVGPLTYKVSPPLPAGLSFVDGSLNGVPSSESPETTYTVIAADTVGGKLGTSAFSFSIEVAPRDPLEINAPAAFVFEQYFAGSTPVTSRNVIGTAKWSISPSAPAWSTFEDGTISGTPQDMDDPKNYTLSLSDDHDTATRTIQISVGDRTPLAITSLPMITALFDHPLNTKLMTDKALGIVTWKMLSGTLPSGLLFDAATGSFFGTPKEIGSFANVVVEASDEKGGRDVKAFTISVKPDGSPITLKSTNLKTHVATKLMQNRPETGNIIGTAVYSATGLGGTGFSIDPSTGVLSGESPSVRVISATISVTDDTQRTASTGVEITVLPGISATQTDQSIVYNRVPPTAKPSYDNAVGSIVWTLEAGTLPKGLTVDAATGNLAGKPQELGTFGPITISARDSLNGTGSTRGFFVIVKMNNDPIELDVSPYVAYKGTYIHTSRPSYDNTLGSATFFSTEATALGLRIDSKTGEITGRIDELMDSYINVSIKDAGTRRVTSKPLHLQIIPSLNVTYPAMMTATQADSFNQSATIAYSIGTVEYSKGGGNWPPSLDVNPETGDIVSTRVIASPGTYNGLSVSATVVSNGQSLSVQSSTFAIKINPIDALPDISNVAGSKIFFGTVGETSTPFTPTVVDNKLRMPWIYSGTTYRLNHDLANETGLSFDPSTGTISGTPARPVIYRDLVITVVSSEGDTDSTEPFWFGVAPPGNVTLKDGVKTTIPTRPSATLAGPELAWTNVIGDLKHTKTSGNAALLVAAANGVLTSTGSTSTLPTGEYPIEVKVTDEFGRTGTASLKVLVRPALKVTVSPASVSVVRDRVYTTTSPLMTLSATGVVGSEAWVAEGLPQGLTFDQSTRSVIGTIANGAIPAGSTVTPIFTVKDMDDGAEGSATGNIANPQGHLYWRIYDTGTTGNWWWNGSGENLGTDYSGQDATSRFQGWGSIFSKFYEGSSYTDVSNLKVQNTSLPNKGRNYTDTLWNVSGYADPWQIKRDANGAWWKVWKFSRPVAITKVTWTWGDGNNAQFSAILKPNIQWSDDGVTWTNYWSATLQRSSSMPQGTTCPSTICY